MTNRLSKSVVDAIKYRAARERLSAGDPLPMIEFQWPGIVLDTFQVDIIRSSFYGDIGEIFIKGCAGAGKGCAVALATNLWFEQAERCKIVICAPSLAHAQSGIFA